LFIFTVFIILPSQTPYDNTCESAEPFDSTGVAIANFNDPDGDCLSNDWVVILTNSEGDVTVYNNEDWNDTSPGSGGWYNFDNGFWDCCDDPLSGLPRSCTWDYNEGDATLTIDCP